MAVKRTGTAKLRQFLEIIGKPLYWLILYLLKLVILISRSKKIVSFLAGLWLVIIIGYLSITIFSRLPSPNKLLTRKQTVSTKIYDRNGILLYKIYRNQNRSLIKLEEMPLYLIQATVAIEDAEFYQHHGLSYRGILRALVADLKSGRLYGGSTITQQLVKNTLLSPERTWSRKIKEAVLALLVEKKFSKEEILQMYLNEVGYGGSAYGIEEASWQYFGQSAKNLNLTQAAFLAGLPASPTKYSPFGAQPELAKERQLQVLKRMRQENFITPDEEKQAAKMDLKLIPKKIDIQAPHFVMYVKDLLVQKYGEQTVEEGGLEVTTSLDLNLQNQFQSILTNEINQLKKIKITNGAALVTNPKTGEILAMVGSADYFDWQNDGQVNVTLRPRQPGSAIKPVNYSIALENGFTPASILSDTPITYQVPGQPPYSPKNYDNRFHGEIPLRTALASSYNVPAVKVLSAFGVQRMIKRGQEMGITTWEDPSHYGLSLTLGGGEVKMIDLAVVYGTLANLGSRVDLKPILEIKNYKGEVLESVNSEPLIVNRKNIISPGVAFLLTDILSDNNARTPAFGSNSLLNIKDHPHVAVKTGTTQNLRDNWTIGYTPDYSVAIWVGNNNNTPMSYVASGITGASPIWNKIMAYLLKDLPDKEFPQPEEVQKINYCGQTDYFLVGPSLPPCYNLPTPTPTI